MGPLRGRRSPGPERLTQLGIVNAVDANDVIALADAGFRGGVESAITMADGGRCVGIHRFRNT